MNFTRSQVAACQRELERTAGRKWVSYDAISEEARDAYEAIGWGYEDQDLFAENWMGTLKVDGDQVALASAFVLSLAASPSR